MTVFGAEEQRVERLTTFVSLVLALILQLSAGLLLVRMCREEVLTRQPPVPLITVNLAPEPAPAGPAKIAAPAPVEETEKVSNVPEISQPVPPVEEPQPVLPQPQPESMPEPQPITEPEKVTPAPEVIQPQEAVPIEPPALQKTEELKKSEPPKKPRISKKAELKSVKPDKKTIEKAIEKPIEKSVLKPVEKLMPQPEPVKASAEPEPLLSTQPTAPALPESVAPALNAAAQADRSAVSQTEKPVKALSGEEQKAIARYLAQIRKSLDRSRVYPPEARKKRIEGIVPVKFRISADGQVVGAEVSGNAPGILAEAVIQMLAGRRFPPPPTGWQPSAAIELNINFNLR